MSHQFIARLPKHLESAYKAGRILVNSGVARCATSQEIVAHLELVRPYTESFFGTINPYLSIANTAIMSVKTGKEMIIDTAKLNQIIALCQNIKELSKLNIAVSGATLGVSVIGVSIIIYQLEKIRERLQEISVSIEDMNSKISELLRSEESDLVAQVRECTKSCTTLTNQLNDLGWNPNLDTQISLLFDRIEALLERLIEKFLNKRIVNTSLELTQCLYGAYSILLKAYLTHRYLQGKTLDYTGARLQSLKVFSEQLAAREILDDLYEALLLSRERRLSQSEMNIILSLYQCSCQSTYQNVVSHHEILNKTPMGTYKNWQKLIQQSVEPAIWLEH